MLLQTWRRRQLRIIGGNLVAFNDVTKRATATIDLKKAISVEDDQDPHSPRSKEHERDIDDFDALYGVERSFRLVFPHRQEIHFFADTDEEKALWYGFIMRTIVVSTNDTLTGSTSFANLSVISLPIPCGPKWFGNGNWS